MGKAFDIQEYMTAGVERVVKDSLRATTLKDPKESIFMGKFALATKKLQKLATPISNGGLLINRSAVIVLVSPKAGLRNII